MTSGSVALASSMSVDFDLRGYGADVASINLNQGGLSLDITGDTVNGGTLDGRTGAKLTRASNGIGVDNGACVRTLLGNVCDISQLDGFGNDDIAPFQFSQNVTIESFTLTSTG